MIGEHNNSIVKTTGDGLMVEFASVVGALPCAVKVQRESPALSTFQLKNAQKLM